MKPLINIVETAELRNPDRKFPSCWWDREVPGSVGVSALQEGGLDSGEGPQTASLDGQSRVNVKEKYEAIFPTDKIVTQVCCGQSRHQRGRRL